MLHAYLGESSFRSGLQKYLHAYALSNATTANLWDALSESSGRDVKAMMDQWASQVGYPVLVVKSIKQEEAGNKLTLQITQRRFLLQGAQEKDASRWSVPIDIVAAGRDTKPSQTQLLTGDGGTFEFILPAAAAAESSSSAAASSAASSSSSSPALTRAFKLNSSQTFLYRTLLHPRGHYSLLGRSLASFSPADRLGLQNDLFAMARAQAVPFATLGEFIEALSSSGEPRLHSLE